MARAFRLQTLLDIAVERMENATRQLQRLRAAWNEAQNKLDQLSGYEREYADGLRSQLGAGMTTDRYADYRLFLNKLATAIRAQQTEVERARQAWEREHANWLALRQREQALSVLKERHEADEARIEVRREQKEQDEFASKRARDRS